DTPVVYGSTVVDFNPRQDAEIARIEMNQRGVLRDFIGIDWDFEVGDEAKLDHVLQGLKSFHEHFQTSVIIYPTFSYPDKPRIRTVMFTENMMDASEYAQAVSFIIDTLKENPRDDDNYSIIKNFNLPVINNAEQAELVQTSLISKQDKPLNHQLWAKTKPHQKQYAQGNKHVKTHHIHHSEREMKQREHIDNGLQNLSQSIKSGHVKAHNLDKWSNFFQFLHAVARAEVLGSITHDDALYILEQVAGGNPEWLYRNKSDYLRELPRVRDNEDKLKRAKRLDFYFGMWNITPMK